MRPGSRLKNELSYKDLAGRRRARRYVLASAAILALLGGIVLWGWWQRGQLLGASVGGRIVKETIATGKLDEEQNLSDYAEAARVNAQSTATVAPADLQACPADPNAWQLVPIAQNDNFRRIDPACVYDNLARTIAWDLSRVTGYSAREAAEALGFADLPWRPLAEITGMTNTQGPMPIALANPGSEEIQRLGHPAFHVWIVSGEGKPAVTFTLRGCYRSETVQGERVKSWGVAFPVMCVVTMDQGEWVVMELGPHRYATRSLPSRRFFMYGYVGEGEWVSLGYQLEPFVEIRLPGSGNQAVLPLTMELEQIEQDRKFASGVHGLLPWDAAWLEEAFGLVLRPLPDNWRGLDDPAEYQAIQDEKELWAKERLP